MNCPNCGARSRVQYGKYSANTVYRRYRCPNCGAAFATVETMDPVPVPENVDCMLRGSLNPSAACKDGECDTCGWNRAVQQTRIRAIRKE